MFSFFYTDPATTDIYTLSLHDALPISPCIRTCRSAAAQHPWCSRADARLRFSPRPSVRKTDSSRSVFPGAAVRHARRSEEHTSELQSHVNLVCRLLLEKKKQNHTLKLR